MESEWFNTQEAARYLGVSASWLHKRRADGKFPAWHRIGRLVRYAKGDLDRWVQLSRKGGENE